MRTDMLRARYESGAKLRVRTDGESVQIVGVGFVEF